MMRQAAKLLTDQKPIPHLPAYTFDSPYNNNQAVQERELAFFFLDIRDFTPFIASRPGLEVIHLLQQLFKIFRQAIATTGGTIIETAGDGFYAVFGLEESFHKAAPSAVKAAFSILQHLDEANQMYFVPFYHHCFQVGIGLHVGKGIIGNLGLGVNNNMTVMGYSVNLAARLQQATKILNNNFIVSTEAYRLLPHPPRAAYKQIALKGIQEEIKVYLLGNAYTLSSCQETTLKVA